MVVNIAAVVHVRQQLKKSLKGWEVCVVTDNGWLNITAHYKPLDLSDTMYVPPSCWATDGQVESLIQDAIKQCRKHKRSYYKK